MTTKFKDLGLYYGYPVCCTESFLKDINEFTEAEQEEFKLFNR